MEMWTGKLANYSHLNAFRCPVYVKYNTHERIKFDPKSKRCIFLGYVDTVKGYCWIISIAMGVNVQVYTTSNILMSI